MEPLDPAMMPCHAMPYQGGPEMAGQSLVTTTHMHVGAHGCSLHHIEAAMPARHSQQTRRSRVQSTPLTANTPLQDIETSKRHLGKDDWLLLAQRAASVVRRTSVST